MSGSSRATRTRLDSMDSITIMLLTFAATMVFVTWLAYRQRNEKRDIALLACVAGVTGVVSAVSMVV